MDEASRSFPKRHEATMLGYLSLLPFLAAATPEVTPDWVRPRPITWNAEREKLTLEYRKVRFGEEKPTVDIEPTAIVVHHTAIDTLEGSFQAFDPVRLPASRKDIAEASALNVSTHFLVDRDGTVYQLLPPTRMARHTIGLNWTAISIENVGGAKKRLTRAQLEANAKLVRWLKERFPAITLLIGHREYQALRTSALWHERDVLYVTPKVDPAPDFLADLRKQVKDLGLARMPADVGPKVDFTKGSPRRYEPKELEGRSLRELSFLRNEIFARHGRTFHKAYLIEYFSRQQWYRRNPGYSTDLLTPDDLHNLKLIEAVENAIDPDDLRVRRNTVFARHGRIFQSPDLAEYFSKQPWYKPDPAYTDARLTKEDKVEIELIQAFERRAATVPRFRDWKPGRRIAPAALTGAHVGGLRDFYVQVTVALNVALPGAPCDDDEEPSFYLAPGRDEAEACDVWKNGRPREDLPAVDRATLTEVERAIALTDVESAHEPSCDDDCADFMEDEESQACHRDCKKTLTQRVRAFRLSQKQKLAAIRNGNFPTGWDAIARHIRYPEVAA